MRYVLTSLLALSCLMGCSSPRAEHIVSESMESPADLPLWPPKQRPDASAPASMVERAKMYHQSCKWAADYPYFSFCQSRTDKPGYEAQFTVAPGRRLSVTHYFDSEGRYVGSTRLLCEGY